MYKYVNIGVYVHLNNKKPTKQQKSSLYGHVNKK